MSNTSSTNGRLVWWILGIFGALLLFALTVIFAKLDKLDIRLNASENALVRLQEQARQVDDIARLTRTEQIERTQRFGDLANRINLLEQSVRALTAARDRQPWP